VTAGGFVKTRIEDSDQHRILALLQQQSDITRGANSKPKQFASPNREPCLLPVRRRICLSNQLAKLPRLLHRARRRTTRRRKTQTRTTPPTQQSQTPNSRQRAGRMAQGAPRWRTKTSQLRQVWYARSVLARNFLAAFSIADPARRRARRHTRTDQK
jgi:hypothetical protein